MWAWTGEPFETALPSLWMARVRGAAQAGVHRQAVAVVDHHAATLRNDPLYLDRCQVDTPSHLVGLVWDQVQARRPHIGSVVDFGAGDARFARAGWYDTYLGYEVDTARCRQIRRAKNMRVLPKCAFSHQSQDADACVGNPPYVRNQDLPTGWRQMAAEEVLHRTGVSLSGLANAWQYFLMLALWSVKADGLVAQVLPFEWVSRPAAEPIRRYIEANGWSVDVYRLHDGIFAGVLTAASITIIDKRGGPRWRFHDLNADGRIRHLASPTGAAAGVLRYTAARDDELPRARRGLSPGTQRVLTLSEGERVHAGLHIRRDVVRCVTSLRLVPTELKQLTDDAFNRYYVATGAKCWLIRTDRDPSTRLLDYLSALDEVSYQTATCLGRDEWWRFPMPLEVPQILIAQAFKGVSPKVVLNDVGAHAVGGVAGIYRIDRDEGLRIIDELPTLSLHDRVVPYAKQMRKLEINQINSLLGSLRDDGRRNG